MALLPGLGTRDPGPGKALSLRGRPLRLHPSSRHSTGIPRLMRAHYTKAGYGFLRVPSPEPRAPFLMLDPVSSHVPVLHGMSASLLLDPVSSHVPVLHGMSASLLLDPVSSHVPVLHGMSASCTHLKISFALARAIASWRV